MGIVEYYYLYHKLILTYKISQFGIISEFFASVKEKKDLNRYIRYQLQFDSMLTEL